MTRTRVLAACGVLAIALSGVVAASPAQAQKPGRYIVVLDSSASDPGRVAADHARRHGAEVSAVYRHALTGYAAAIPEGRLDALRRDPRVARVEADGEVVALHSTAPTPTGIHRTAAVDNPVLDIDGIDDVRVDVDIAVLDTGIDPSHPDLNVAGGRNCQSGSSYADGNGHGTHVAGTAAGLDRGSAVPGVAPGARLWAVRVLDNSGSGTWSSIICGIDWVTARNTDSDPGNDIEVANMSLGGSGSDGACWSSSLHQAICNSVAAGVTYVVAAGNSSADAQNYVPATYAEVITVSALADFNGEPGGGAPATCRSDSDDTFANFSNYGADVDLIAPGVCIRSAWTGGGYSTISGTSMASPHVAGAAALYKATVPSATPAQVRTALQGAGSTNWNNVDDRDGTKEVLLDVRSAAVFSPATVAGPQAPGDAPPSVTVTSPSDGAQVSGTVALGASASDDAGVTQVEFFVDRVAVGVDANGSDGWTASWDTTGVADGAHTVTAVALDTAAQSASHSVSVTVANGSPPASATEVTVSAVDWWGSGGRNGNKDVFTRVTLTDDLGAAVGGAGVSVGVYRNGALYATGSGTTSTEGTATWKIGNAPSGTYTLVVLSVSAPGLTWDGTTPSNGFTK